MSTPIEIAAGARFVADRHGLKRCSCSCYSTRIVPMGVEVVCRSHDGKLSCGLLIVYAASSLASAERAVA